MFESDVPMECVNRFQSTDEVGDTAGLSDTCRPDSIDNCELHITLQTFGKLKIH